MSLKMEFVERAAQGEKIAPLCREFGISRATGHKWMKRFKQEGYQGLDERSRRPASAPLATAEDIVVAVLEARDAHPSWGPQKLAVLLRRRLREQAPSPRTIARILKRADRVRARRRRRPVSLVDVAPQVEATKPNDVWTIDFKGWWRAINGQRCEPLTVRDAFSRFVLDTRLCRPSTKEVRAVLEKLFERYGLPDAVHFDNGVPFVSVHSVAGLSPLSAWLMSLGIRIVRSRPRCPQDNGGHERMHRDIRAEVQSQPAQDREEEQKQLDRWRQEFNHVRPHQALENRTPAEVYRPSSKRLADARAWRYPAHIEVYRIQRNGCLHRRGEHYFVTQSLRGHDVGLERIDDMHAKVWFRDLELRTIELAPDLSPGVYALVDPCREQRRSA